MYIKSLVPKEKKIEKLKDEDASKYKIEVFMIKYKHSEPNYTEIKRLNLVSFTK